MALTPEQVEHVAALARLGISEAERQRFAEQLSGILDHFQALQALDTEQIPPTAQVLDLRNVMRTDAVCPSLSQGEVLANAPRAQDGFFRVQAVLEE
ncbi:MAG TPA: Asp-tRNA(Asn)/Glu-tRNA(Gln) amidotransferase subunit GatC [Chloroflexota bacterium]|jgi:aspartyl-tRNA(Asn)/glutamyl-tRNA(Gln) amidotransferase subunit C|nr:Asp-tRNA(Asn)/Glu-tRNA(Gln) amidotransferase subunit GatC [Chloroflexota bacterium]